MMVFFPFFLALLYIIFLEATKEDPNAAKPVAPGDPAADPAAEEYNAEEAKA